MLDLSSLLNDAPLGDKRLKARALLIVESILQGQTSATHGTQGVGHADPFAHVLGAFRFFDNDRLKLTALYSPIKRALAEQIPVGNRCYIVHDLSPLDYSQHQAKQDLIQVGNEKGFGYGLYSGLVLTDLGMPLGPVVQEVQTTAGCLSSESDKPIPFVDHLSQVERGAQGSKTLLADRERVHLLDREFDDLQLLRTWHKEQELFVIRCQHLNRRVSFDEQQTSLKKVVEAVKLGPAGAVLRDGVSHDVFMGETCVTFAGKSLRGVAKKRQKPQPGSPLSVRVVVTELRREGHKPLSWVLLTNLTDSCGQVVQAYAYRWKVERFFYLNKVGFRLEQWRQESGERIVRRLAVTQLAAMAIYLMQEAATKDPIIDELLKEVATLGGWLGRKRDPIGPIVLMRGMLLLVGMVRALREFGAERLMDTAQRLRALVGLRSDD